MSNLIRQFIYNNVAKQTKVVAHIVDGAHRLSAIECAMIGILPSTEVENKYHERLTHANVLLPALVLIIDDNQLSEMPSFEGEDVSMAEEELQKGGRGEC